MSEETANDGEDANDGERRKKRKKNMGKWRLFLFLFLNV